MRRFRNDLLLIAGLAALAAVAIHRADDPPSEPAPYPPAAIAADLRIGERRPVRIVYQPLIEDR